MNYKAKQVFFDKVCIVGGGPVGLGLALTLAKYNIKSIVLEAREEPTDRNESRAITWMPRGLEFLAWLGIEKDFLDQGVVRYYHQFENNTHKLLTWSFKEIESPYPYSVQLPQHNTEMLLEKHARETGLVEILRGHEVVGINQTHDQIKVKVQSSKEEYEIYAPWGVACDGAKSKVVEALQIKKSWKDYGFYSAVADFEMDCERDKELSNIVLDPSRPYGFFYFAPGKWRLIYRINKGEDRTIAASEDFATQLLKDKLPNARIHRFLWASSFRLGQGQLETYHKGRWLIAGDAAHTMGPSAGAGMMVGLLGAWRLGWRLALSMKGHVNTEQLLLDYSREQHSGADEIQSNNAIIFKNMSLHNPFLAGLRSFLLGRIMSRSVIIGKKALEKEALLRQILPVEYSLDHTLSDSDWKHLKKVGSWILGQRMPYLRNEKENILSFTGLKHTVFSIGASKPVIESILFEQLIKDLEVPVENTLIELKDKSSHREDHQSIIFAIIRPDQHIVALVKPSQIT